MAQRIPQSADEEVSLRNAHYSVSQIEHAERCWRSWAIAKLDGRRDEGGRGSNMGALGHEHMEKFYRDGVTPSPTAEMGRNALTLISAAKIPPKHPKLAIEAFWKIEVPYDATERITILGYMDLFFDGPEMPIVFDHKFLSAFDWAKSADTLRTDDVQSTLYMFWAMATRMRNDPTWSPKCGFQWNNGLNKGSPKALVVKGVATLEDILPRVAKSIQTARVLHAIRKAGAKSSQLLPNFDACLDYGGRGCREFCDQKGKYQ
jgi:hypothetical protein